MNVLIVEDNPNLSNLLCEEITRRGDVAKQVATLAAARSVVQDFWPDAVLLDAMFPEDGGAIDFNAPGVLQLWETQSPESRPFTILMSGDDRAASHFDTIKDWWFTGRIAGVVSKNQEGGWDFLKEILLHHVTLHRLARPEAAEADTGEERRWLEQEGIISTHPAMYAIARAIHRMVAGTDNQHNFLIIGASGTGKSLIARAIWKEMQRQGRPAYILPFEPYHCGSSAPGLIHSDLVGQVKGAYTDAKETRMGYLETAGAGVLFLDDIHMIPAETRRVLLRPLQDRVFRKLGGSKELNFDARVVAATNVDPEELYKNDTINEEFYERIAGTTLIVPPLSQRPADVEAIAKNRVAQRSHTVQFSADAMRAMQAYGWPGNVRQLRNIVDNVAAQHKPGPVTLRSLRALQLHYLGKPIEWLPGGGCLLPSAPVQVGGWCGGLAELGPGDEVRVLERLRELGCDGAKIDALVNSLAGRKAPKPIHYFKALLFVYLRADKRAGGESEKLPHKAFEDAIGLGWDFTNRILAYLSGEKRGAVPGFEPPVLVRDSTGGKYTYALR